MPSTSAPTTRAGRPLQPAMGPTPRPEWSGARWIGAVEVAEIVDRERLELAEATGYDLARILIRRGGQILGVVECPISDSSVDVDVLLAGLARFGDPADVRDVALPPITVAVSTRDRPESIRALLGSLLALDYPDFEIVVVDNASATDATARAVHEVDDPRVRLVREPRPGLSRGRNTAVLEAAHDIIAFTDDDVLVDPLWLRGIAQGFARADDVGLVCGVAASGELLTAAQGYFEARIAWETSTSPRIFSLADPPSDIPLFPFDVGFYGTGANFAVRREVFLALGGANEALGVGSPTRGGEDIDLFVRTLYAGHTVVYEPTSLVWHRHRRELAALEGQVAGYGRGFGAWIATVLCTPGQRRDALRLLVRAARRTGAVGTTSSTSEITDLPLDLPALRRREVVGMVSGPWWYVRSRLDHRRARPLAAR